MTSATAHGWILAPGDFLRVGDWMASPADEHGNVFVLTLLGTGDLILCFGGPDGHPNLTEPFYSFWNDAPAANRVDSTFKLNTASGGGQYVAVMQSDGNLVLYPGTDPQHVGRPCWASNTAGQSANGCCLTVGVDGNVRVSIRDPQTTQGYVASPWLIGRSWETNLTYPGQRVSGAHCLQTAQWLGTDGYLLSPNKKYAAYLQGDGNLVLCPTDANNVPDISRPYWSAFDDNGNGHIVGGHNQAPFIAIMQDDGNFVLYNGSSPVPVGRNKPYWASKTAQATKPAVSVLAARPARLLAPMPASCRSRHR